jgi:hypothetical protein
MNNSVLKIAHSSFSFLKIPHITDVNVSNSQLDGTADNMDFDGKAVSLFLTIPVPGFSPGRPGFIHRAVHVNLVEDKMALQQAGVLRFSLINIIHPCNILMFICLLSTLHNLTN